MVDMGEWLRSNGLEGLIAVFRDNDIDGDILFELKDEDLKELGLTLGLRKKLLRSIRASVDDLGSGTQLDDAPRRFAGGHVPQQDAERRQLTVMFVDLVASTSMSTQLDPEELRTVLTTYQNIVAGAVTRYEGIVAKYMGDGVLAYFGWPRAHENDAERAVRTALALLQTISEQPMPTGEPLRARIGIATGLVIVGDLIGEGAAQEEAVVGETPNLAARLQDIAEPGEVVIAETTRKLVGEAFELSDHGQHALKGIAGKTPVFSVKGIRAAESRFEAHNSKTVGEMVGRDHELGLVLERWQQSLSGDGQLVLLTGEAGIGKSRITRAVVDAVSRHKHTRISYQCSPYHTDSALYPAIQQLNHVAGISFADSNDDKLDKLEAVLLGDEKHVMAKLLDLKTEHRYGSFDQDPQQLRWRTLRALASELATLALAHPVLFILEDAHWIDATTLEMVELCLDNLQGARVLMLMTARPTFEHQFSGHPSVTRLVLNRLTKGQIVAIATKLAGGKELPAELLEEIAQKTDGVPLFVEELTKTVLESDMLLERADRFELGGPISRLAIPATLHDSLMARLDRLQPVKEVAQMAACIGREFGYQLLAEISPLSAGELKAALDRLMEAGLIFRRGLSSEGSYIFKHALVRDAAYESLLKARRKSIHAELLAALEARDDTAPELLASHAAESKEFDKAINYWQLAGEQARNRSAVFEAIAHLSQARSLLLGQPHTDSRDERELELLKMIGSANIAAHGYGARETIEAFDAGLELTKRVDRADLLFPILYGQYVYRYIQGGGNPPAYQVATRMLDEAVSKQDPVPEMIGHRCVGMTLFCQGEFDVSEKHFHKAIGLYRDEIDHQLIFDYGTDSKVSAQVFLSTIKLLRGFPEQSAKLCEEGFGLARRSGNIHTLQYALLFGPIRHCICRHEYSRLSELVTELGSVADEYRLPMWQAYADTQKGWLLSRDGNFEAAMAQMRAGLAGLKESGVGYDTALVLGQMSEAYFSAGQFDEGLDIADQALAAVQATNERWFEPEIHRLRGELILASSSGKSAVAKTAFDRSLELSRAMGTRWWELRTTVSIARNAEALSNLESSFNILRSVYDHFTEGDDTPDVAAARKLLAQV